MTQRFSLAAQKIEAITSQSYGKEEGVDIAMRVISDHLRAVSFAIADGQNPSNVKAGYVIRRILRRCCSIQLSRTKLPAALLHQLVSTSWRIWVLPIPSSSINNPLLSRSFLKRKRAF